MRVLFLHSDVAVATFADASLCLARMKRARIGWSSMDYQIPKPYPPFDVLAYCDYETFWRAMAEVSL